MPKPRTLWVAMVLALALAAAPVPASAGIFDYVFVSASVTSDRQLFVNLAVRDSGADRVVLEPLLPRLRNVDVDLPVILFLAGRSGRPVDAVVGLRVKGLGWDAILRELGLSYDVLFVGIDRDPGPPYGKAWGYWKKNPRGVRLVDADVVALVEVQLGGRLSGVSAFELARSRGGRPVIVLVADKHGRPYKVKVKGGPGRGKEEKEEKGEGQGKGKGKGKEKH